MELCVFVCKLWKWRSYLYFYVGGVESSVGGLWYYYRRGYGDFRVRGFECEIGNGCGCEIRGEESDVGIVNVVWGEVGGVGYFGVLCWVKV